MARIDELRSRAAAVELHLGKVIRVKDEHAENVGVLDRFEELIEAEENYHARLLEAHGDDYRTTHQERAELMAAMAAPLQDDYFDGETDNAPDAHEED